MPKDLREPHEKTSSNLVQWNDLTAYQKHSATTYRDLGDYGPYYVLPGDDDEAESNDTTIQSAQRFDMFITRDSGQREAYASGMVRDTQDGKPRYELIDRAFLKRWAELMARGAVKYGADNWRMANSHEEIERFKASALRHMMQWLDGDQTEDHAAAVAFNIAAAEYTKVKAV